MFNLQGSEIIVILLLALVVLGPEKLPDAIRRFSRTYGELKKMGSGFQSELKSALDEPIREMRETADMVRDAADPDKIAADATASGEAAAGAGDDRSGQPDDASGGVIDPGSETVATPPPGDPPLAQAATDDGADPARPDPAAARVNQIAAANSSGAIAGRAAADAAANGGAAPDAEPEDGDTEPPGDQAHPAPVRGPAFHAAAPRLDRDRTPDAEPDRAGAEPGPNTDPAAVGSTDRLPDRAGAEPGANTDPAAAGSDESSEEAATA